MKLENVLKKKIMKNLTSSLKRVILRTRIIRTVEVFVLFIFILTCMYIRNSDNKDDNFDNLNKIVIIEENDNNYITESQETLLKNAKTSVNLDIPEETSDRQGF